MASNYTSKYKLNQWAAGDKVLRTEFNTDNARVEAALAGLDSSKASNTAVNNLSASLNSLKTSVNTELDALKQTADQHAATLTGKGNCQIYTTSYVGTGLTGSENPNSLTFPHKPFLVIVSTGPYRAFFFQGVSHSWSETQDSGLNTLTVHWERNSVSWYAQRNNDYGQMNHTQRYYVLALLELQEE